MILVSRCACKTHQKEIAAPNRPIHLPSLCSASTYTSGPQLSANCCGCLAFPRSKASQWPHYHQDIDSPCCKMSRSDRKRCRRLAGPRHRKVRNVNTGDSMHYAKPLVLSQWTIIGPPTELLKHFL